MHTTRKAISDAITLTFGARQERLVEELRDLITIHMEASGRHGGLYLLTGLQYAYGGSDENRSFMRYDVQVKEVGEANTTTRLRLALVVSEEPQ